MIRSVLAILAGIAALTISSFAIEAVVDALLQHVFPRAFPNRAALGQNMPASLLMFAYTAMCVVFGGYVTAWIAKRRPVAHAVIMGGLQVGLTIWAYFSMPQEAPWRNWIIGMVFTIPAAWLGGLVRSHRALRAALESQGATRVAGLSSRA